MDGLTNLYVMTQSGESPDDVGGGQEGLGILMALRF